MPFSASSIHHTPHDGPRAVWLRRAIERATTDVVAWITPGADLPDAAIASLGAAFEDDAVAVATAAGAGRSLTLLGVADTRVAGGSGPLEGGVRDVLFAPAGLCVFHRRRVLGAGGVDGSLVYGHEDANLGWRLALKGLRSVEVPAVRSDGAAPSTVGDTTLDRRARATRLRHQIASELATLFVCAGDDWQRAALPCAIARQIGLAAVDAGLTPDQFDFGRSIPDTRLLPVESLARLLAIDDLIRHLPRLRSRRLSEQSARTRSDAAVRELFAPGPVDDHWLTVAGDGAHALCRMLGLDSRRGTQHPSTPAPSTPAPSTPAPTPQHPPSVSIVILTASGPRHLPVCLESLAALDYPKECVEVIVVDNGSAEDPTPVINRCYPGARVIRNGRNLGFCGGNNVGVLAASHEWLFFLNDDTRADPHLLTEVLATAARREAASVAAFVVNWDGERVDFAGGGVNFEAHGFQRGVQSPRVDAWKRERPIAFANGAAMLIRRGAYDAAGGFPEAYFAYYEDVALGWALWIQGQQVWLSPRSLVYHLHHGTSGHSAEAARIRHCERNACFTLLTHPADDTLGGLLSASLLLAAERVVLAAGLGGIVDDRLALADDHRLSIGGRLDPRLYVGSYRAALRTLGAKREHGLFGSLRRVGLRGMVDAAKPLWRLARWGGGMAPAMSDGVETPAEALAALVAVAEACRRAGEVEARRHQIQASRRMSDRTFATEVAGNWLDVIPVEPQRTAEYERAHGLVVQQFGL